MTAHFVNLLDELRRQSLGMAAQVEDMLHEAGEVVFDSAPALAPRVVARDAEIDAAEVAVEAEVIRLLALYQPVGIDLRTLCTVLKVNSDLERIADCAVNIAERARHGALQPAAQRSLELRQMCPLVRQVLHSVIQAYRDTDAAAAREVLRRDDDVDALYQQIIRTVVGGDISREQVAGYLDLVSVAKNLERVADHATNIAEDVIYLSTGKIVRHQHEDEGG
jgi:phosphate transport system protein